MSRIGKNAVPVPQGVEVKLAGQVISAKGKLGQGSITLVDEISAEMQDGKITVTLNGESETFERPKHKDVDAQEVIDLRHLLESGGFRPE